MILGQNTNQYMVVQTKFAQDSDTSRNRPKRMFNTLGTGSFSVSIQNKNVQVWIKLLDCPRKLLYDAGMKM